MYTRPSFGSRKVGLRGSLVIRHLNEICNRVRLGVRDNRPMIWQRRAFLCDPIEVGSELLRVPTQKRKYFLPFVIKVEVGCRANAPLGQQSLSVNTVVPDQPQEADVS